MDALNDETRLNTLIKPLIDAESISNARNEPRSVFNSPIFRNVNCKPSKNTPSHTGYSESSDYDFPSYQVNQSVNKRTSSKSENETNDISIALSPVLSPVLIPSHRFRPPSIHTLDSIAKKTDQRTAPKTDIKQNVKKSSVGSRSRKKSNIYENLRMTDLDISWVSSMASPPAPVPNSEFNTIEKATFFPSEKFQKIQPRALFSPTSDDNFGCSLLPMSSASEDEEEAYKTKMRLSDVCATLRELEFKSQEKDLCNTVQDNTSQNEHLLSCKDDIEDDYYCSKSPVFVVKPMKAKIRKKKDVTVESGKEESPPKKCGEEETLKEVVCSVNEVTNQSGKNSNNQEDESFLDVSFTEIDIMCKTLLDPPKKIEKTPEHGSLADVFLNKRSKNISLNSILERTNLIKRHFYRSECSAEVEHTGKYFSSYEEIHNNKSNKTFLYKKMHQNNCLNSCKNEYCFKESHKELESKKCNSNIKELAGKIEKKSFLKNEKNSSSEKISTEKKSSVEMLDEEEKMLLAVEEAEKTLAEEAQMVKAIDEMESTLVLDCSNTSRNKSHVKQSFDGLKPLGVCKSPNQVISVLEFSEKPNPLDTSFSKANFGFSTASGAKMSVSEKALEKAKQFMEMCEEEENKPENSSNGQPTSNLKLVSANHFIINKTASKPVHLNKAVKSDNFPSTEVDHIDYQYETNLPEVDAIINSQEGTFKKATFKGFSTANGLRVTVSKNALLKAKELMENCDGDESYFKQWDNSLGIMPVRTSTPLPCVDDYKGTGIQETCDDSVESQINSGKTVESSVDETGAKTEFQESNYEEPSTSKVFWKPSEVPSNIGFSTASGSKVSVSAYALTEAKKLLAQCDAECNVSFLPDSMTGNTLAEPGRTRGKILQKAYDESFAPNLMKASTPKMIPFKTNEEFGKRRFKGEGKLAYQERIKGEKEASVLSICDIVPDSDLKYQPKQCDFSESKAAFAFSTASGLKVSVSEKSLQKAKFLMAKCDKEESLGVFPQSMTVPETGQQEGDLPKQKPDTFPFGFTNCLGKKLNVSTEALKKARQLMSMCDETGNDSSCANDSKSKVINQAVSKSLFDEANPEFSQDGSILSQRCKRTLAGRLKNKVENSIDSLVVSCDTLGEMEGASIPAEEWDKSFTIDTIESENQEIFKKRKFDMEEVELQQEPVLKVQVRSKRFSPPRKGTGVKRSSEVHSPPSKRSKCEIDVSEFEISLPITERRSKARQNQENAIKAKKNVKPVMGLHLKKKTTMKQTVLFEAVGYKPPLLESVIKDSSDVIKAGEFKFGRFTSDGYDVQSAVAIQLDDDFQVIPDDNSEIGVEEFKKGFLAGPGVQPNLIPQNWIENHFKWIVWKLQNYERYFPFYFKGKALTLNNVMLQLKYRYDREIDRHERSALKKILEKDDTSIKRLVLQVCGIKKLPSKDTTGYELELTDGWYSCPARVDPALSNMIENGKVTIGMKLITQGAILVNCDQGMPPLEITENVHLRIFTNSTRRVAWNAKLGFQRNPGNITVNLDSIFPEGGPVSQVDIIVVRLYPLLFSEKTSDGRRIVRNRRAEEKVESEYRKTLEQKIEKIYSQVYAEIKLKGDKKVEKNLSQDESFVKNSSEFSASSSTCRDMFNKEISARVDEKLRKENLARRDVTELLKVKIVDARKPNFTEPTLLSIWGPGEDIVGLFTEGKAISLMNLTVSSFMRGGCKQINATRQTRFKVLNSTCDYPTRRLVNFGNISMGEAPAFGEIDLVGIVISVKDFPQMSSAFQIIYLADSEFNFTGLSFWGGLKEYGWENVLVRQRIVACSNLYWKSSLRRGEVPVLQVKETSLFTENPRTDHLKAGIENLKKNLPKDINEFLSECEQKLASKLENNKSQMNISAFNDSHADPNLSTAAIEDDQTEAEAVSRVTTRSAAPKHSGRGHRTGGKSSGSCFRWLPYKNV